jgi:hypothetical protein
MHRGAQRLECSRLGLLQLVEQKDRPRPDIACGLPQGAEELDQVGLEVDGVLTAASSAAHSSAVLPTPRKPVSTTLRSPRPA